MVEKQVVEDEELSGITTLRQRHEYPTFFRMGAGTFHALNAIANAVGGVLLIVGKDATLDVAMQSGVGIQARTSVGYGLVVMGAIVLVIALFNSWLALSFFSGRQEIYRFAVLTNGLAVAAAVIVSPPNSVLTLLQTLAALLIVALLLLDPRIKAFYYRGAFRDAWWNEEMQRRRQAGKP